VGNRRRINQQVWLLKLTHHPAMVWSVNGIELQQALTAKALKIPMIFITAYPDERIRAKALDGGAICFLNKPFGGSTIIECIERALSIRDQ
jgi:FixJ family two-component response regulator